MPAGSAHISSAFLGGESRMERLIREKDWKGSSLGEIMEWPQALRFALNHMLDSCIPMLLCWGPEYICFYNEAYRKELHLYGAFPFSLGASLDAQPNDMWLFIKPLVSRVSGGEKALWSDSYTFFSAHLEKEELTVEFSISPIKDEALKVAGVLIGCHPKAAQRQGRKELAVSPAAMAVMRGRELLMDFANTALLRIWQKKESQVKGNKYFDLFPGLAASGHSELIERAYAGRSSVEKKVEIRSEPGGPISYLNYIYTPFFEADNQAPAGLLLTVKDITQVVESKKKIEENEERYRLLIQRLPVAAYTCNREGYIKLYNRQAVAFFGYEPKSGEEKWFGSCKIYRSNTGAEVLPGRNPVLAAIRKEEAFGEEDIIIEKADGSRCHVMWHIQLLHDLNGKPAGALNMLVDITPQKRTELWLRESEERLRLAMEGAELASWDFNIKTLDMVHSPKLSQIFGYEPSLALTHRWLRKHIHPDDRSVFRKAFATARQTGEYSCEIRIIRPGGDVRWIRIQGKIIFESRKRPVRMLGTLMDITGEKLVRQRDEETEARLKMVIEASDLGTWELHLDAPVRMEYSRRYIEIFGYKKETRLGHEELLEHVHPDDLGIRTKAFETAYRTGTLYYIARLKWKDGSIHWVEVRGKVFYNGKKQPFRLIGTLRDLTEEIARRKVLEESERRLRIAALSSEMGTWDYDPVSGEISLDSTSKELHGMEKNIPVTLSLLWSKIHPDDRRMILKKMLRAQDPELAENYDVEYRIRGLSGDRIRWVHAKGKALFDKSRRPYLFSGTVLDMTEKRIALNELRESEKKFRLLADSLPQFIWTGDQQGNLNYFNRSVYRYSGLSAEETVSGGWLNLLHPADKRESIIRWKRAIRLGEDFLFEHRFLRHDGAYRWQLSRAVAQRDPYGEIQMWVGTSTDIHDRKLFTDELESKVRQRTLELHKLNEELTKSNSELAQFAYIASHDLQEPLRKIQAFATRVLDSENKNLSEKGKDYFARMQSASKRMQQLIVDLLSYSRANTGEKYFEQADLNVLLSSVKDQLNESMEQKKAVLVSDHLPSLRLIPYQFEQLLTNILGNALKFCRRGIAPEIKISYAVILGENSRHPEAQPQTPYHYICIRDNGIGFDPKYSERIFQVFQRLHGNSAYSGTGIGLAIVKKIMDNHGGLVKADGMPEKGAAFHLYLPVA